MPRNQTGRRSLVLCRMPGDPRLASIHDSFHSARDLRLGLNPHDPVDLPAPLEHQRTALPWPGSCPRRAFRLARGPTSHWCGGPCIRPIRPRSSTRSRRAALCRGSVIWAGREAPGFAGSENSARPTTRSSEYVPAPRRPGGRAAVGYTKGSSMLGFLVRLPPRVSRRESGIEPSSLPTLAAFGVIHIGAHEKRLVARHVPPGDPTSIRSRVAAMSPSDVVIVRDRAAVATPTPGPSPHLTNLDAVVVK
jgi:hypothetical protein